MTDYIGRMEQEFKETHDRFTKGAAYLTHHDSEIREKRELGNMGNSPIFQGDFNHESEMLREQLYSMNSYLKSLGSRIMFAKAKEGLL